MSDRRGIAGVRAKIDGEMKAYERELMKRLIQSARISSLAVRVDHRIDNLRKRIEQHRAALRRLDNASAVVRLQHRRA